MSKITTFNPTVCKALDARIKAALAPLAEELGIQITIGGGSYLGGSYKPKFEVAVITADGLVLTPEAMAFKQCAGMLGLKPDDLGRTFPSVGNRTMKITGYRTRAHRRPITTVCVEDGKTYVFETDAVKRALEKQAAQAA